MRIATSCSSGDSTLGPAVDVELFVLPVAAVLAVPDAEQRHIRQFDYAEQNGLIVQQLGRLGPRPAPFPRDVDRVLDVLGRHLVLRRPVDEPAVVAEQDGPFAALLFEPID